MSLEATTFTSLQDVAADFRSTLENKKYISLFAYNGTGKTRLSMEFKDIGKGNGSADTLYFNAFTEDLFNWDNDLDEDSERRLIVNTKSRFFSGLLGTDIDSSIRDLLIRYADFDFKILSDKDINGRDITYVSFEREIIEDGKNNLVTDIKISRSEESIFIWCFFLAFVQTILELQDPSYGWVKYIYIDDPVSSLDENNIVMVACDLIELIDSDNVDKKFIISTHHNLFQHILINELKSRLGRNWEKSLRQYHLNVVNQSYTLYEDKGDSPMAYHLALLKDVQLAIKEKAIQAYHFNIMRSILEKTASFFGHKKFSDILNAEQSETYSRLLNLYSHGKESSFDFREPSEGDKKKLEDVVEIYLTKFNFSDSVKV